MILFLDFSSHTDKYYWININFKKSLNRDLIECKIYSTLIVWTVVYLVCIFDMYIHYSNSGLKILIKKKIHELVNPAPQINPQ